MQRFEHLNFAAPDLRETLIALSETRDCQRRTLISQLRALLNTDVLELVFEALTAAEQEGRATGALTIIKALSRSEQSPAGLALRDMRRNNAALLDENRRLRHDLMMSRRAQRAASAPPAALKLPPLPPRFKVDLRPQSREERVAIVKAAPFDYSSVLPSREELKAMNGGAQVPAPPASATEADEIARTARRAQEYLRKCGGVAHRSELSSALDADRALVARSISSSVLNGLMRREGANVRLIEPHATAS